LLTNSSVSVCPRICARQQYLLMPSLSRASFCVMPDSTSSLYCAYRCAIGFPQLKHLIGIIILMERDFGL
jgi:hypothetical protein